MDADADSGAGGIVGIRSFPAEEALAPCVGVGDHHHQLAADGALTATDAVGKCAACMIADMAAEPIAYAGIKIPNVSHRGVFPAAGQAGPILGTHPLVAFALTPVLFQIVPSNGTARHRAFMPVLIIAAARPLIRPDVAVGRVGGQPLAADGAVRTLHTGGLGGAGGMVAEVVRVPLANAVYVDMSLGRHHPTADLAGRALLASIRGGYMRESFFIWMVHPDRKLAAVR